MTAIRVLFQTNGEAAFKLLCSSTVGARKEPGCLQAETFRSVEFPDHCLMLELWESPTAWDAHWALLRETKAGTALVALWHSVAAPFHNGYLNLPRRTGENGLEFYKHEKFVQNESIWTVANETGRSAAIRWPADGKVRILGQLTTDAALSPDAWIRNSIETRKERGCLHFEFFRSVDFPENAAIVESWSSPEIYDIHWIGRLVQRAEGSRPHRTPVQRRYGEAGFEFYSQCRYSMIADLWMPETADRRMSTIRW